MELIFVFAWRGLRTSEDVIAGAQRLGRGQGVLKYCRGRDHDDRGAGFLQHQRGAGPAADQRHSSAIHFLRRVKPVCDAGQRGRLAECEPADGVRDFSPLFLAAAKSARILGERAGNPEYRQVKKTGQEGVGHVPDYFENTARCWSCAFTHESHWGVIGGRNTGNNRPPFLYQSSAAGPT